MRTVAWRMLTGLLAPWALAPVALAAAPAQGAATAAAPLLAGAVLAQATPAVAPPRVPAEQPSSPASCRALAETPWPITVAGRAQLLARLEDQRDVCIAHAPFLSLLGALWLEQGDPGQALLWLERSLMLDPNVPATLADHALALAALGDRTAVIELLQRWRDRSDVPPLLRARLELAQRGPAPRLDPRAAGLGSAAGRALSWRRTLSLMRGHETNLDHSPRLSEITLSSPDGPVDVPLINPIIPRRGQAWVAEGSLQALFSAGAAVLWQGGMQFSGRHAEAEPQTDTRQLQLALVRWQQHDGWRSQLQAAVQRVTGPLNEPFNTYTLGVAGEREWNGCFSRLGLDTEWRRQDQSRIIDSHTVALQGGLNCRFSGLPGWGGGAAMRWGWDRPRAAERPGGVQRQASAGLRLSGPLGAGFRIETSARLTRLSDRDGYSPLLNDNARRQQTQQQHSIEISRPLPALGVSGVDLVFQLQHLRQTSNLQPFNQSGRTAFAGLRADW